MKVGIIVHSQTGHTSSLAAKLEEGLVASGHEVTLHRLKAVGPATPGTTDVQLETRPEIDVYDALVFGSPVWGGQVSSPMASYLGQTTSLQDKKIVCLVTHFFPPGIGANQALAQMKEMCQSKGATVLGSGDVAWPRFGRKRQIAQVIDRVVSLLG